MELDFCDINDYSRFNLTHKGMVRGEFAENFNGMGIYFYVLSFIAT